MLTILALSFARIIAIVPQIFDSLYSNSEFVSKNDQTGWSDVITSPLKIFKSKFRWHYCWIHSPARVSLFWPTTFYRKVQSSPVDWIALFVDGRNLVKCELSSTKQRKPSRMVTSNEKSSSKYKTTIIGWPKVFCPNCTKWSCVTSAFAIFPFSLRRFKTVGCGCSKRWRTSWLLQMNGRDKSLLAEDNTFRKILKETSAKLIEFRGLKYMLFA